jgi:uncharacterized membrane protein YbaN (DUF454 family)
MKNKLILISVLVLLSIQTYAQDNNFISGVEIDRIYINASGYVFFGVTTPNLPNTCSFFLEQFVFQNTLDSSENVRTMYAMLLSAKLANRMVHIWYTSSTAPDTNQTNGCSFSTIAKVTQLGIR